MDSVNALKALAKLLGLGSAAGLARWLGFAPQHVSRAKRPGKPLSPEFEARVRDRSLKLETGLRTEILKLLNPGLRDPIPQPDATSRAKSGWDPAFFEPIEKEAWDWALSGRNYTALHEIFGQARRAGFACTPFKDGLDIGGRTGFSPEIGLHSDPPHFGLQPGTRLLLGAAARHGHAEELREVFNAKTGKRIEFHEADSGAYFGYATVLKYLLVPGRELLRPERYAIPGGLAYRDVGVISFGPRLEFYPEEPVKFSNPRLIWLAATQRLSNYVGARLLADLDFRKKLLGEATAATFYTEGTGVLVFSVTVLNEGGGSCIGRFEYMQAPEFRPVVTVPAPTT